MFKKGNLLLLLSILLSSCEGQVIVWNMKDIIGLSIICLFFGIGIIWYIVEQISKWWWKWRKV